MNVLGLRGSESRFSFSSARYNALFVLAIAVAVLALTAGRANAAFTITNWALTPSTTQAAGHPNVNFHLDPDAAAGDQTGDDLKMVTVEFAAGMLANPASIATPCTSTQFSTDKCPSTTQIGTVSVQYRRNGQYFTMSGTAYEITADPNSVMTIGMIVRPSGYQKVFLKTSKVSGLATVRTGVDADYGVNVTFDNIPRTLTTSGGTVTNVTISDVTVNLPARSNSSSSGPYFTFNPTRCTPASTRATMTSYLGVSVQKTSSFTPTGCSSVPFNPTFAITPSSKVSGAPTGLSATVTVPTADATIQQSHVQSITTTLGNGTTLNFPNISAVGALCTDAQLGSDTCPAASQIGTSSVSVPFLPPAMTGKIYLMGRSSSITFGYTLHGSGNTLVTLKGSATSVDLNNDGASDAIRAYLIGLPQAPFSSATLNFTSLLINNATCTGASDSGQTVTSQLLGYSGASVSRTVNYSLTNCEPVIPDTTITSSPVSPTSNATPSFTFVSVPASGPTFQCSLDASAFAACTSPYTVASALTDGSHTFSVRAVSGGTPDPTPASATFVVDRTPPVVMLTQLTLNGSTLTASFTATDANGVVSTKCSLDGAVAQPCTSPVTYTGLGAGSHTFTVTAMDAAGNSGSASGTVTPPVVPDTTITSSPTSPTSNAQPVFTFVSVPAGATFECSLDGGTFAACTSPYTVPSPLADGSHTFSVRATSGGTPDPTPASVTFIVDRTAPAVNLTQLMINGATLTASFTATDANGVVSTKCSLDGAVAQPCTSPVSYNGIGSGVHTFVVTATDAAGNSGSASGSVTPPSPPLVTITSPVNGSTVRGSSVTATFSASSSLPPLTTTCKLDGAAATTCTSPQSYTGLAVGSHTLIVTAIDSQGNTGSASTTFTNCACAGITITSPTNGAYLGTTSPTVSFTNPSGATGITCQLDTGTATACTSPFTFTGVAQGQHTVTVAGTDSAGPTSANVTFKVDTIAPVINLCGGGPIIATTSPPICFTVTDASPVTVTCKVDGSAAVACTSPWTPPALGQGSHTITICATDAAGNTGCITYTFTVDTIAPVVVITSPTPGSITSSSTTTLSFTASDSGTGVASVTCKIDGGSATNCTSPTTYAGLAFGAHTIQVCATDFAGNTGCSTVTFTYQTTPPPNPSCTVNGTSATCTWTTTPNSAYTCKMDAGTASACTPNTVYTGLAPGTHTFTLTVTDQSGTSASGSYTFVIPPLPTVTITSPAEGSVIPTPTPSITFTVTGSPTSITCSLDGSPSSACTSPVLPTGLSQGAHSFQVCATNGTGTTCKVVHFSVDSVPPVVVITSPPNNANTSSALQIAFTATDATTLVTGTTCKLDAAAAVACTNPWGLSGLAAGSHSVTVSATDTAGNVGSATVTFVVGGIGPGLTINSPAEGSYLSSTSVSVSFTVTLPGATVTCSLDNGAPAACTSPISFTGLTQGQHCVTVSATDGTTVVNQTRCFIVDTIVPQINANASTNPVTFSVSDASPIVALSCTIDNSPVTPCTNPWTTPVLPPGSHSIKYCATDIAGNVACVTVNVTILTPPTISITSPAEGSYLSSTTPSFAWTTTGTVTTTSCTIDSGSPYGCGSGSAPPSSLSQGSHTLKVCVSNSAGSACDTRHFTVDSIPPTIVITSPPPGSTVPSTGPVTLTFTVTDASPVTTTCAIDGGPAAACSSGQTFSGLALGSHTIQVCATDAAGNMSCAITTFTYSNVTVTPVIITGGPGPASGTATPTYSFNAPGASGYLCSMDGGPTGPCFSPFTTQTLTDQSMHTFTVVAQFGGGGSSTASSSTWVDTRAYGATATLTQLPNTLTTAANVSAPAAHPNIRTVVTVQGAADAKNAVLTLPHGLQGSLASIPDPSTDTASTQRRCSITEANSGTCPASSIVGTGNGTISVTDSSTPVTVTGTAYLTDAPTSNDAAGLAVKATVPGGRGDIIATGVVNLINNGATVQMSATNIPQVTTLGIPFHALSIDFTVNGDTGGAAHPLVTNPSYCGTPSAATGTFAPFNASTNPTGYIGQFNTLIGNTVAYDGSTATTTVPYPVTGCSNTTPPFNPTFSQTLLNPTPGTSTAAIATVTVPQDNSSIFRIFSKEPPKIGPNLSAYGNSTDMCPASSAVSSGAVGVGNLPFNPTSCPAQARIGQVRIQSPLLDSSGTQGNKLGTGDGQIVADVYLINKSPLPWLGIHVDPSITYPGRGTNSASQALKNPQGVTANLMATTATPTVHPTCSSANGDTDCGLGMSRCDTDTMFCQTQISVTLPNIPDIPMTSTTLYLGVLGDGTTPPPGRIGTGGITSNNPLNVISVGDNTCSTGVDPNSPGADTGSGAPFSDSTSTVFTPWRATGPTGAPIGITTTVSQQVVTPSC